MEPDDIEGFNRESMGIMDRSLAEIGLGRHFIDDCDASEKMLCLDQVQDNVRYDFWVATGSKPLR
ncbi:hypothetical protein OO009_15780, partial [Flavobacteriaceae bacterium KMM 6897]|nr:hypothetical protein [Flavobacteriaceae bacterium KMM 6897]